MLAEDVSHLMEDFGSTLTVTRSVPGTYTPSTGAMTGASTSTFTVRGVFINYVDANVDGTVVRMGDRRLLIAATGAGGTPAVGDRVSNLQVIDVRTIAPNGVTIAWACQMRK
jgi:hypothetical protein